MPPTLLLQAPSAPTPPPPPGQIVVQVTPSVQFPVPQTAEELRILQAQRQQISDQIGNVRDQRRTLAQQYEASSGASRAGLAQQLQSIDERLLQLQNDLAESGRAVYNARVATTAPAVRFPIGNLTSGQVTGISIIFILFVLGPLAGSVGRLFWRRAAKPATPPGWNEAAQRLERLEQAVDTIAIEVERVSEGQRFMTKLMTQGPTAARENANVPAAETALNGGQPLPALGPGAPEPVVFQNQREEVRVRRS